MRTRLIEATNGPRNWGKFLIGVYDKGDWAHESAVDPGRPLLRAIGTHPDQFWMLDLQTGEGAMFRPDGYVKADLDRRRILVCLLFEPLLEHLYAQWPWSLDDLPDLIDLPDAPAGLYGYRRPGPEAETCRSHGGARKHPDVDICTHHDHSDDACAYELNGTL